VARARGELDRAEELYRRSLEMFEAMGTQPYVVEGWHSLGEVARERGDLSAAAQWYRQARRRARTLGRRAGEAFCILGQARARLRAGRPHTAALLLKHAHALVATLGRLELAIQEALLTGELRLRQGALAEAQTAAEEAVRLALAGARRADEAVALHLLGQCALAMSRFDEAEDLLRSSLQRQTELGAALQAARTRVALAGTLVRRAKAGPVPDEARRLLADAQAQFAASGAALDLFQAQQAALAWASC
jgi:tetratricopeptide (TPR) repeat protein